ncbi:TIGR03621 family F420-dependent LLM class oxidoreductase [Mycolicibacterium sp. CR10]|uniref:TIGR03621 family F420-dependent LLM class oxidoreductase n=1 Tax=Mycolicibacterium sp. CR10 TaxID=2562314 RepID=UPI0010C0FFC5|nr:TIGR03621 family F420-dependent LLM class oxidoreductase [Mycolicibacterium sp. CR10]
MVANEGLEFIAPMPRLHDDGAAWVAELRRLEDLGFDTVTVSHHLTNGWQLAPIPAMAFAAASTTRLRVQSLVVQNPLQHPALLAKDIATIDRLSCGRVELGLGAGWLAQDYAALGVPFESTPTRIAQLAEAVTIIRDYFTTETVDFAGRYYHVDNLEALPRCVQQPNPPILIGAGGPRMLDLAGRCADIVGVQARMMHGSIDDDAVADLSAIALQAKITRIRDAAAGVGRATPRLQFSVSYLHVTDSDAPPRHSTWTKAVVANMDTLAESPAVLVGTAAECAEKVLEHSRRFGISYWHLGQDTEAAGRIIALLRQGGVG